ncbi:hypothetical protein [uncultured Alistipes sp.]|jgi:hypothetical protein|uniref:hypothetical protein n=1 Tax=uncultured Alistipes sp. TaxID=538949 RepID=UPI0025E032EF|nr:hypothetical protein [uncultured Alistipes sp.]
MHKTAKREWLFPNTIAGWVLLVFGAFALLGGLAGIIGFGAFTLTSVSAVNNGILHFIGVLRRWSFFSYYAIISRTLMGCGLLCLAGTEADSGMNIEGAIFEFAGVLILIFAMLLDARRVRTTRRSPA